MKYKLKDLDNIETKAFAKMYFDSIEDIEKYLRGTYTRKQKEIQSIIELLSLKDTLKFLNISIIKIPSFEEFYCRTCTDCHAGMNQGYCIENGSEYYCSDECLHKHYSKEEWEKEIYGDDSYWTEWDKEEEFEEYLKEIGEK